MEREGRKRKEGRGTAWREERLGMAVNEGKRGILRGKERETGKGGKKGGRENWKER